MSKALDPQELIDYFGRSASTSIVSWRGSRWYAKTSYATNWRELLAYRLGHTWLNVAEVIAADAAIDAHWLSGDRFLPPTTSPMVLVRLGQDHHPPELPLQVLETAIAYELVSRLGFAGAMPTLGTGPMSTETLSFLITT